MRSFTAVIEKCTDTGLFVGYVPGFPGAHTQGKNLDELNKNLKEVLEMLLEDGLLHNNIITLLSPHGAART